MLVNIDNKGYMGECGLRGGYSEIINMDPAVKALYLKSISAKLCPTGKKLKLKFLSSSHVIRFLFSPLSTIRAT